MSKKDVSDKCPNCDRPMTIQVNILTIERMPELGAECVDMTFREDCSSCRYNRRVKISSRSSKAFTVVRKIIQGAREQVEAMTDHDEIRITNKRRK